MEDNLKAVPEDEMKEDTFDNSKCCEGCDCGKEDEFFELEEDEIDMDYAFEDGYNEAGFMEGFIVRLSNLGLDKETVLSLLFKKLEMIQEVTLININKEIILASDIKSRIQAESEEI